MNNPPASAERVHAFDHLRALAMLLGVLFHASLAYSPIMHGIWPTADVGHSTVVDVLAWFAHLFRMPVFFVVAGFFVAVMVQKHGLGGMLGRRVKRVLLPLVLFWPLLYFSMDALTMHALNTAQNPSPLLLLIKQWLQQPDPAPVPPSLMHLWFLYYLMCFCVLTWVAKTLEVKAAAVWFVNARWRAIILVMPLVLLPAAVSVNAPMPAPESFLPQWWALLYFGCYFFVGYQLHQRRSWAAELKPLARRLFLAALAAYGCFFWVLHQAYPQQLSEPAHWLLATLQAYAGFWLTLCCLRAAESWLDQPNRVMRYLADASYWVYLVHLPILFAIQYQLLDIAMIWPLKFAVSVLGTCMLAFGSYQLIVRRRWIGRMLNSSAHPGEFPTASRLSQPN